MPEKTNKDEELTALIEKKRRAQAERGDEFSWSEDQKKRGYYYDDETNYQVYDPENDDDDDESGEEQ